MTASRDGGETEGPSPTRRAYRLGRAYRLLVRGVRWLREFNRGYSGTGHLPNRKK